MDTLCAESSESTTTSAEIRLKQTSDLSTQLCLLDDPSVPSDSASGGDQCPDDHQDAEASPDIVQQQQDDDNAICLQPSEDGHSPQNQESSTESSPSKTSPQYGDFLQLSSLNTDPASSETTTAYDAGGSIQHPVPRADFREFLSIEHFTWRPVGFERAQKREQRRKESIASSSEYSDDALEGSGCCDDVAVVATGSPGGPLPEEKGGGDQETHYGREYVMFGGLVFWPGPPLSAEPSNAEDNGKEPGHFFSKDLPQQTDELGYLNFGHYLTALNTLNVPGHCSNTDETIARGRNVVNNEMSLNSMSSQGDHRDDLTLCRSSTMPELRALTVSDEEADLDVAAEDDKTQTAVHLGHHANTMLDLHGSDMPRNETGYLQQCDSMSSLTSFDDNRNNAFEGLVSAVDEENADNVFEWEASLQPPDDCNFSEPQLNIQTGLLAQRKVIYSDKFGCRRSVDSGLGSVSEHAFYSDSVSENFRSTGDVPSRWNDARFCPDHPGQHLSLYCTECCRLICVMCFAASHMDCARVLTPTLACRDVRWQLLKLQSQVCSQISGLQRKVEQLKPVIAERPKRTKEAKERLNEQFHQILKQLEDKHRDLMAQVEARCISEENMANDRIQNAEKSLLLLSYVSKFVQVLRKRDSAWELLDTYDMRLSHLLKRVMRSASASLEPLSAEDLGDDDHNLTACQLTALQVALDGLELDSAGKNCSSYSENVTGPEKIVYATGMEKTRDDNDALMSEILAYLNRFPPPSSCSSSSCPGEAQLATCAEELDDDVFNGEGFEQRQPASNEKNARMNNAEASAATTRAEYKVHQRLRPDFPQDEHKPLVTDIHVTETGRLVLLDVANECLKRVEPRQPSFQPRRLHVQQPISMCSAGWERMMVSRAGRVLSVYEVGGQQMRLVSSRNARHQYHGLARASDALVAAASPENRSVDLLDLSGRVLRSIMPVDFVTGPDVVGAMATGELLVVYQPPTPPTTIVCFDMKGQVLWQHELHMRERHVTCSRVVGGADGCVYYVMHGDSAVYRYSPKDDAARTVLTATNGIQLPTTLAVDDDGRVVVSRSELLTLAGSTPVTTEIDFFLPDRANK